MRTFSWRASILSKRQRSTDVAASEKSAKFTPLPSHVAPSGYGKPSQVFTEVISAPRSYRIWNTLAIIKIARFPPKLLALHSAARVAQPSLATVRAGDPARINATPAGSSLRQRGRILMLRALEFVYLANQKRKMRLKFTLLAGVIFGVGLASGIYFYAHYNWY